MRHYPRDPYFTTARFASTCPETGRPIRKGDPIAYYPRDRRAYHETSNAAANIRSLQAAAGLGLADADW